MVQETLKDILGQQFAWKRENVETDVNKGF